MFSEDKVINIVFNSKSVKPFNITYEKVSEIARVIGKYGKN